MITDEQAVDLLVAMAREYYHRGVFDEQDFPANEAVGFDQDQAILDAESMLKSLRD